MSDTRAPAFCFLATPSFLRSYITSSVCFLLLSLPYFSRIVPLSTAIYGCAHSLPTEAPLPSLFPVPTGPPLTVSRTSWPDYSWIGIATNCLVCVLVVCLAVSDPSRSCLVRRGLGRSRGRWRWCCRRAWPCTRPRCHPGVSSPTPVRQCKMARIRASTHRQIEPASSSTQPPSFSCPIVAGSTCTSSSSSTP